MHDEEEKMHCSMSIALIQDRLYNYLMIRIHIYDFSEIYMPLRGYHVPMKLYFFEVYRS